MVERKGKSRGLGRGLSSLMGDINNDPISSSANSENQTLEKLVPVEKIYPNPNNGRKLFGKCTENVTHVKKMFGKCNKCKEHVKNM